MKPGIFLTSAAASVALLSLGLTGCKSGGYSHIAFTTVRPTDLQQASEVVKPDGTLKEDDRR